MPAAVGSKLIACDRADTSVTAGPPVCCQVTFCSGPLQPATTAPAVRPTGTDASATTLNVSPATVQVGVGPIVTGGGGGAGTGAGAGEDESPPQPASRALANRAAEREVRAESVMGQKLEDGAKIAAGPSGSMPRMA